MEIYEKELKESWLPGLFCGLTSKSKQLKARVFPHLVVWIRLGRVIPHDKVFVSLSVLSYSKE
jgi:hypothetical protein